MVDVGDKPPTIREASARARVVVCPEALSMIRDNAIAKGDVLGVARVAGIMATKRTADLIPLCHPLQIAGVQLSFSLSPVEQEKAYIDIDARVRSIGPTGVEMEALTAVGVAALTIYDMCKAVDRGMVITDLRLMRKSGGRSGEYVREEP
jgi:cyclic pyranopterin phosphate synthase